MNYYALGLLAFFNLFSQSPPYYKFENEIIEQHRKETLQPIGLNYSIIGGGNQDGIKIVQLGVSKIGPGSIEEGRRLIVFLVENLIARYNTHQKIRPHLNNYPYTAKNVIYRIWYNCPKGGFWVIQDKQHPEKEIALIDMYKGKIEYDINFINGTTSRLRTVHTETYEEAKKIVMEEQNHK